MIRVTVELVPYGDEKYKKTIGSLVLATTANLGFGQCEYHAIYDVDDQEDAMVHIGPIKHSRKDGFWELIKKILNADPCPPSDEDGYFFNLLRPRLNTRNKK